MGKSTYKGSWGQIGRLRQLGHCCKSINPVAIGRVGADGVDGYGGAHKEPC